MLHGCDIELCSAAVAGFTWFVIGYECCNGHECCNVLCLMNCYALPKNCLCKLCLKLLCVFGFVVVCGVMARVNGKSDSGSTC